MGERIYSCILMGVLFISFSPANSASVSSVVCTSGGTECKSIGNSTCDTAPGVLKCKCDVGFKENATDDSKCVKAHVSEVVCTENGKECQNIVNSACDTPSVLKCKCIEGYKQDLPAGSSCVKVIGSQCTGDSACPGASNSKCDNGKCACAANFGEKNDACKLTVGGTVCTDGGVECDKIENAKCDADGGKCKCSLGFTMNIDTCIPENGAATSRHMEATMLAISVLVAIKGIFG